MFIPARPGATFLEDAVVAANQVWARGTIVLNAKPGVSKKSTFNQQRLTRSVDTGKSLKA